MYLKKHLPRPIYSLARTLKYEMIKQYYRGDKYYCPVCQHSFRHFVAHGYIPRLDAKCPHCLSLERHRLIWVFLKRMTDLFDCRAQQMLHIAPEPAFESRFRSCLGDGYLTADLVDPHAMVRMDITDIQYPDNTFDVIYCSHVLEHVPEDRRAIHEFYRTLKPGGWALLIVPITAKKTFEDPSIESPAERLALFGATQHVRRYGPDFVDRLEDSGFATQTFIPKDFLSADEIQHLALTKGEQLHFCTKN